MEAAGAAVAHALAQRWTRGAVTVLCGPGNNGGDGFVAARHLRQEGWPVRVAVLGNMASLRGDAALQARAWAGAVEAVEPGVLDGASVVVDALFGAGLSRALKGAALDMAQALNRSGLPVCAVDVPSGLDGATGQPLGVAVRADLTVSFFRKKPGHLLLPGRTLCGELICAPIGIPDTVLEDIRPTCFENHPDLWRAAYPWPLPDSHKYRRGHVLVVGGERMLGAARLASLAAARVGAGLVTLATPPAAWPIQAAALTSIMVEALPPTGALNEVLADTRRNGLLIGPGIGVSPRTQGQVLALLARGRPIVLDADALSAFEHDTARLLDAVHADCVLTPHEGEFARLFNCTGGKLERAREAARLSGAVLVLKGADTVVAHPDGRAVINANAPPELATGGTGDVLAGMIVGLLAQGMSPFDAACAAVYLHGLVARLVGVGLMAEDLPAAMPAALRALRAEFSEED
jgi:NAD(P)H-hydrate epimerase